MVSTIFIVTILSVVLTMAAAQRQRTSTCPLDKKASSLKPSPRPETMAFVSATPKISRMEKNKMISLRAEEEAQKRHDGMPILPSNVVKYSQVPKGGGVFTASSIPRGLLNEHSTKTGTWGVICVSKGMLEYQINSSSPKVFKLDSSIQEHSVGIIVPTVLHQVKPLSNDVEFVVEFHREAGTGPVDEKRE